MIQIKRLSTKVLPDVLDLVVKHYSRDLFKNLFGLQGDDIDLFNTSRVKMYLNQNWSVGAFDKETNNLVGVTLNEVQEKRKPLILPNSNEEIVLSNELKQVIDFMDCLESNVLDLLQVDKVFYSGMAAVHKMHRRKGITSNLRKASEALAKTAGCNYIVSVPTNEYLCRFCSRNGYKILREVNYLDYYSKKQVKIFQKVTSPYNKAQLVYKKI